MPRLLFGLLLSLTLSLPGCGKKEAVVPAVTDRSSTPRAAVKLTIMVVDDPEIAAGIGMLRGEWAERSGGELIVQQWTSQQLNGAEELTPDLVIYPSRYLGALVDRQWLRPVRKSLSEDGELNLQDIYPLLRNRVMRFGGEIFGLSLGEPPLMLAWDGAVPSELGVGRSFSWSQCDRLSAARPQDSALKSPLAVELIVRAVGYDDQAGDPAILFDSQTMEPQLLDPPFVRAFHDLKLLAQKAAQGEGAPTASLSWPTASPETATDGNSEGQVSVSFFAIPRAEEVYDRSLGGWSLGEESNERPVFLGFSGCMVSVSRNSRNAVSAFMLLKWLASGETAIQVTQRSNATIWFRRSQASQSAMWLGGKNVSGSTSLAVTKLLSSTKAFVLPRIPGIDEYLELLEKAIADAQLGEIEEEDALRQAVSSWRSLTDRYGKQRQLEAYRRHLGFNEQ